VAIWAFEKVRFYHLIWQNYGYCDKSAGADLEPAAAGTRRNHPSLFLRDPGGLIQLSLPLGIQSIIGFVLGAALSTSLVILIYWLVGGAVQRACCRWRR
jgi:hypothetical protein